MTTFIEDRFQRPPLQGPADRPPPRRRMNLEHAPRAMPRFTDAPKFWPNSRLVGCTPATTSFSQRWEDIHRAGTVDRRRSRADNAGGGNYDRRNSMPMPRAGYDHLDRPLHGHVHEAAPQFAEIPHLHEHDGGYAAFHPRTGGRPVVGNAEGPFHGAASATRGLGPQITSSSRIGRGMRMEDYPLSARIPLYS